MNTQPELDLGPISRTLVPENERMKITHELFGIHFPLRLEPFIYAITSKMAKEYHGGFWNFYTLSNGGFYMAPNSDEAFQVSCENLYEGKLSADALGIVSCLYAFSHLSFGNDLKFAQECARQYHLLREYMIWHPEAPEILGATD